MGDLVEGVEEVVVGEDWVAGVAGEGGDREVEFPRGLLVDFPC